MLVTYKAKVVEDIWCRNVEKALVRSPATAITGFRARRCRTAPFYESRREENRRSLLATANRVSSWMCRRRAQRKVSWVGGFGTGTAHSEGLRKT